MSQKRQCVIIVWIWNDLKKTFKFPDGNYTETHSLFTLGYVPLKAVIFSENEIWKILF